MRHQQGKIKREHHTLKEFDKTLKTLEAIPEIQRIIPGRIYRTQQGNGHKHLTISYKTPSGFKLHIKKGGTSQELFITCKKAHSILLQKKLESFQRTT